MKAFILNAQEEAALQAGVTQAFLDERQTQCLAFNGFPVISGPHAGKVAILFPDGTENISMRKGNKLHAYQGFTVLIASLGGLDSRVEVDEADLADPVIQTPTP